MDKKSRQILLKTFWHSGGWKPSNQVVLTGPDFDYALSQGVMFDPITITYDELVDKLRILHEGLTIEQVSEAFLHSLSTRKLHLRSALSSWVLTRKLLADVDGVERWPLPIGTHYAPNIPLMFDQQYTSQDLNVLQFERVKWGGVRLNWLLYCWLDLELFSREAPAPATQEDVDILRRMLLEVTQCEPSDGASKLQKRWKDLFPSNKNERDCVMEILGFAGVLATTDAPRIGRGHDNDLVSTASWQGQDGYPVEVVEAYFGRWGIDK